MNSEVTSPWIEEARQIAAQCWCHETTAGTEMDVVLAERVAVAVAAWMDTAAQAQRNTGYYRGLLVEIGEAIGQAAYVADDGGVSDSVLCAKVPDLVRQLTTPPASGEVVGVPVGWALVPIEPTQEMLDEVTAADQHEPFSDKTTAHTYRAMLSAAPKQAMGWRPIESAPRDGTWIMLAGGKIDYGWYAEQPPFVVGQWTTYLNGGTHEGRWQFAWYDGGYYGEYEAPTQWRPAPLPSPPEKAP